MTSEWLKKPGFLLVIPKYGGPPIPAVLDEEYYIKSKGYEYITAVRSDLTLRRTPISIESIDRGGWMTCIVSGVPNLNARWISHISLLPERMAEEAEEGRIFFGRANLKAERNDEMIVTQIEPRWGDTSPLHFHVSKSD